MMLEDTTTTPKKILVAEDEAITLRLFQFQLERSGFTTQLFKDGYEVIERAREDCPDLAILDYNLPGRNGLELIQGFKGDPLLSHVPIIVVTGFRDPMLHMEMIEAGANEVINKPFSPARLTDRINELTALPS